MKAYRKLFTSLSTLFINTGVLIPKSHNMKVLVQPYINIK
jgi:hypothetical protein